MTARKLEKKKWKPFFERVSQVLGAKQAEVEVLSLGLGDLFKEPELLWACKTAVVRGNASGASISRGRSVIRLSVIQRTKNGTRSPGGGEETRACPRRPRPGGQAASFTSIFAAALGIGFGIVTLRTPFDMVA